LDQIQQIASCRGKPASRAGSLFFNGLILPKIKKASRVSGWLDKQFLVYTARCLRSDKCPERGNHLVNVFLLHRNI
jgi:hypothetical protein